MPQGDRPLPDILEDLERQLIARAYEKAGSVKTETARLLGIKTSALYYKLEKYGFISKGEAPEEAMTQGVDPSKIHGSGGRPHRFPPPPHPARGPRLVTWNPSETLGFCPQRSALGDGARLASSLL